MPIDSATPAPDAADARLSPVSNLTSPATIQTTSPNTSVIDPEPAPTTSINYLRKLHGPRFAPGFDDNDRLSDLLAQSGASTLLEYLRQNPQK